MTPGEPIPGSTTAEAAEAVREIVPQGVISEAAKTPALQAGQVNDRSFGGLIGAFIAYGATHVPGYEIKLGEMQIAALYTAASTLGTQIGAKIPEEYRPWLVSIGTMAAILFGIGAVTP